MEFDINDQKEENGIIVAPAGCGKTESITKIIKNYDETKKILVLTHTNAGIENIEKRLKKNNISQSKCSIYTIASFCSKYVNCFKMLSSSTDDSYDQIYIGMNNLLDNKHIKLIIKNTYFMMLVDEYQDCSLIQHSIIKKISNIINFKIFGDPLQSIYDFKELSVKMSEIIDVDYKLLGYMTYPWRWSANNQELGKWIMKSREEILKGNLNIFKSLPNSVQYFEYTDYMDLYRKAMELLKLQGRTVILFNVENQANSFCKKLGGKFYYQEEIQCKTLNIFVQYVDNKDEKNIMKEFINICKLCFTNFSTEYNNIVKKIEGNDFNLGKLNKHKEIVELITMSISNFKFSNLLKLMNLIEINSNLKIYRKELWLVLKKLIERLNVDNDYSAKELLISIRNSNLMNSKFKYKNMVSRILLVKGLEFENVFLINPNELSAELLYVAISRPTQNLIVAKKI